MKNKTWLYWAPVVILCFVAIFSVASKKAQKKNVEVAQIHHAAESVINIIENPPMPEKRDPGLRSRI